MQILTSAMSLLAHLSRVERLQCVSTQMEATVVSVEKDTLQEMDKNARVS